MARLHKSPKIYTFAPIKDLKDFKAINPMHRLFSNTGNYKDLITYQKADAIYQITYYFCHNYLERGDRTVDQMIQAARSGKQNIVEGCAASATSSKTEIHLTNVAKASLKELLEDYEDYLHTRHHVQWQKGGEQFEAMRKLGSTHNDAEFYMQLIETRPPETIANIAIILLNQLDYLLFRQLDRLAKDFENEGGFSERMSQIRREKRDQNH